MFCHPEFISGSFCCPEFISGSRSIQTRLDAETSANAGQTSSA